MKVFKVRMISDLQSGVKGMELQVQSSKSTKPEPKEVQSALEKAGIKLKMSVSWHNFEVI